MDLNRYEQDLLAGKYGDTVRKLMEIMVRIGEINDAKRLMEISSVHLASTLIYIISGDTGMELMADLSESGLKFKAFTLMDPVSIDIDDWGHLGTPEEFAQKQMIAVNALKKLGAVASYTCTPYLSGYSPKRGDHLAWVETSAVIFANSYYGARTNREVDVSALASAICGKTPEYGYHLSENRKGTVWVNVSTPLRNLSDYGALGYHIGKRVGGGVPVLTGIPKDVDMEALIALAASLATSGSVALFHVEGVTPEANTKEEAFGGSIPGEEILVGSKEIEETYQLLSSENTSQIDLVAFGCPHASLEEIRKIAGMLEGKKINKNVELVVYTSKSNKLVAARSGLVTIIEKAGGKVVADTCMVLTPTTYTSYKVMATDSAKAAYYVPGWGVEDTAGRTTAVFGTKQQCVDAAIEGRWRY
jgi:predicted aconitase